MGEVYSTLLHRLYAHPLRDGPEARCRVRLSTAHARRSFPAVIDPSGTSGRLGTSTGAGSPSGETTSGSSSGENAAKAPATGTTPGGAGRNGANGTSTDSSSGSTNSTSPGK